METVTVECKIFPHEVQMLVESETQYTHWWKQESKSVVFMAQLDVVDSSGGFVFKKSS